MVVPPLHQFLQAMLQKQTMSNDDSWHQQRSDVTTSVTAEHCNFTLASSCCWTVAPDNASSHSATRVHWNDSDTRASSTIVDCRWGNSSWSSNQEFGRPQQWVSATSSSCTNTSGDGGDGLVLQPTTKPAPPSSSSDCFLVCPKRRDSLEAEQLIAFVTKAMDVFED